MLYHSFENRTVITGTLEAIDPIHVGASARESLNPVDLDAHVLKDATGNPVIPGSSIKGAVRSRFEAVMRGLGERVCDIFDERDASCVSKYKQAEIRRMDSWSDLQKAEEFYKSSCTVCKLFGGRAIAGKLRFKDCSFIGDRCVYEKRDGVGIDRDTGAAKQGAKYDFEVIPKGSCFDFTLIAENLDEQQFRYLEFILRMLEGRDLAGDYLAVGGKTTRGMGRVCLKNVTRETVDSATLRQQLLGQLNS